MATDINEEDFISFFEKRNITIVSEKHNFCPECGVAFLVDGAEFNCPKCNLIVDNTDYSAEKYIKAQKAHSAGVSSSRKCYGMQDSVASQIKYLTNDMETKKKVKSNVIFIPSFIIKEVIETYNRLQSHAKIVEFEDDGTEIKKNFVQRGESRDSILSALIFYKLCCKGLHKKKNEISEYMNLGTGGYAIGENKLIKLQMMGYGHLINDDLTKENLNSGVLSVGNDHGRAIHTFTCRCLEKLEIRTEENVNFVAEIIQRTKDCVICPTCVDNTKVIGAIYLIVVGKYSHITPDDLEKHSDGVRKNTFGKFKKAIYRHYTLFRDIFDKYEIFIRK